jgi:hypothetical protein
MGGLAAVWLGLYLSVNQTGLIRTPLAQPGLAAEATAIVGVGKATVTAIYIQPVQRGGVGPLVSVGVGFRVF